MQKAMFFEDAFKKGILGKVSDGYIMSVSIPDFENLERQNDPIAIEMISYSGVKSIIDVGSGVKFQAQGKKMFCLLEPVSYTESHVDPVNRSASTTGHLPFRFSECDSFLTKDNKVRVLLPRKAHDCFDSFTVSFPHKGDLCILYFIFDKNIDGVVLPFIQENLQQIIQKTVSLRGGDSKTISDKFINIVKQFKMIPSRPDTESK